MRTWRWLCGSLLWLPVAAAALCEKPWVVSANDWRPYMVLSGEEVLGGSDIAVVQKVAARLGCELRYVTVPPARAHAQLREGGVDIMMAASDVPERRAYAWFSQPYRQEIMVVLAPASAPPLASFGDILKRDDILLAPRYGWYGDAYAQWRDRLLTAGKLQLFDEYGQGLAMLQVGRGTLIMGDEAAMQWEAGVQGLQLQRQFVANASPVHLMLSRRTFSEADIARINAALVAAQSTSGPAAGAASQ